MSYFFPNKGVQFLVNFEGSHFTNSKGPQSGEVQGFVNPEGSYFSQCGRVQSCFQSQWSNFWFTRKCPILSTRKGPNPGEGVAIFGQLRRVSFCQLGRVPIQRSPIFCQSGRVIYKPIQKCHFFFQSEGSNFRSTLKDPLLPTRKGPNPKRSKCLPIQKGHFSAKAEGSSFFRSEGSKF